MAEEDPHGDDSLTHRTVRSGGWSLLTQLGTRVIGLTQTLILARWLAPDMFGLFGLTMLTLSLLETVTAPGLFEALIQRKKTTNHLDTAWTVNVLRGTIISAAILFLSPWVATFFGEPRLRYLLAAGSVIPFFSGIRNIAVVYFQKELSFRKEFIFKFTPTLMAFPIVVTTAYFAPTVWVLILMILLESAGSCLLSFLLHDYRPSFSFDFARFKELFSFGRWVMGTKIMKHVLLEGDDIFVGKFLGSQSLGIYQLSYRLSQLPVKEITTSLTNVLFPAFSKLKDDRSRLREAWLNSLRIVSLLSIPISTGIFVLAPSGIEIVLGPKWMEMVGPVRMLSVLAILRSINYGAIFKATDNPQKITKFTTIRLIAMVLLIVPLTLYLGVVGTALTILLSALLIEPLALKSVLEVLNAQLRDFLESLALPFVSSGVMVLSLMTFQSFAGITGPVTLILSIVLGASTYFSILIGTGSLLGSPTNSLLFKSLAILLQDEASTKNSPESTVN